MADDGGNDHLTRHPTSINLSTGVGQAIARTVPAYRIHETLGQVKESGRDGKVTKSRGAVFISLIKAGERTQLGSRRPIKRMGGGAAPDECDNVCLLEQAQASFGGPAMVRAVGSANLQDGSRSVQPWRCFRTLPQIKPKRLSANLR